MATDNSEVLDISKENIQPLRHGRKAAQLKTALQAQIDPSVYLQLMKQREKFEYNIRMYEGEDPLEPYYNYILWLEQSFPSMSRENNVLLLLEDTLLKFKDFEKYKQDPRLVQLIIKYISFQPNALELYQLVYNQGLGTMCSSLYKAWAEELEKVNDFKRADQVFQLGLQCRSQPIQELQDAHIQFQLSIARKLIEGNVNPVTTSTADEQSRAVLSKLQPSKLKSSRSSKQSAGVFSSSKTTQNFKNLDQNAGKFQVYQENIDDNFQTLYKNKTEVLPKGSSANRENVMGASKWYGQKVKQLTSKISSVSSAPAFDIHEDPEAACGNIKTVIRPCALKVRKEEFKCPVAIFGPPNPNQLPMYPKQLVYVGGRDVQLEEIRAAFYWKKIQEEEQVCPKVEPNAKYNQLSVKFETQSVSNSNNEQQTQAANLFPPNQSCNGQGRGEELSHRSTGCLTVNDVHCDDTKFSRLNRRTKLFQSDDSQPMSSCDMLITPARAVTSIEVYVDEEVSCSLDNKSKSNVCGATKSTYNLPESSNSIFSRESACYSSNPATKSTTAKLNSCSMNKNYEFLKTARPLGKMKSVDVHVDDDSSPSKQSCGKQMDEFDFMGTNNTVDAPYYRKSEGVNNFGPSERENINFNHSLSTSMTVNTKAAMNVIQQMWESPLTRQDIFEAVEIQPPIKSNKCLFPVYCEDDDRPALKNKLTASNKISFPIFCDDTFSQPYNNYSTKANDRTPNFSSKFSQEALKSSSVVKKSCETERKFGTHLPLIVPVKFQDSPVEPENKENRFPVAYLSPDDRKNYDEDGIEGEHFDGARNCEIDDETCNTKVFAVDLPSSTPRSRRSQNGIKSVYDESYFSQDNNNSICCTKSVPKVNILHNTSESYKRCNKTNSDLSLILENSKEQGSGNSSGSSGLLLHESNCLQMSKKFRDLYKRDCMVVPENKYSTMVMMPDKTKCPPFDCWKSQLTVISKANLTWIYNNFRNKLAEKFGIRGMVKMNWHWMLETDAMKILKNCPSDGAALIETRDIGGLDYQMSCEESVLTIPKFFKTQTDFLNDFPQLLNQHQKDVFSYPSSEQDEYFRLPSASHIGCAVLFTNDTARLVCVYCAKADLLLTDFACPDLYDIDPKSEFIYLCAHEVQHSVYGCEPVNLASHCTEPEPDYRKKRTEGSTRRMYSVTDGYNFLIFVNDSDDEIGLPKSMLLGCEQQGGRCAPPLPAWNYVYEPKKIVELNQSVYLLRKDILIRYGTHNVYYQLELEHRHNFFKAECCIYILIIFIVTAVPILIVMYFTNVHRKEHP